MGEAMTGGGTISPTDAQIVLDKLLDGIGRQDPTLAETEMVVPGNDTSEWVAVDALAAHNLAGRLLSDLDALRDRFVPAEDEALTEEDFISRGVSLVAVGRNTFIVLGELLDWKMQREQCADEISRNALIERYAPAWGVSTSALWKAWVYANRFPGLILPEDTSQTLAYEILSGCQSKAEADAVLDRAIAEGWSVRDVREIKNLRGRGLLKEWVRLKIIRADKKLHVVGPDGEMVAFARLFTEEGEHSWVNAGMALLEMRAGL